MRRVGVVESKFGLESSSVRSSGTAFNKSLHENEDNLLVVADPTLATSGSVCGGVGGWGRT
jgi:uracil phosphoribosyltransferase